MESLILSALGIEELIDDKVAWNEGGRVRFRRLSRFAELEIDGTGIL
jgi:hypothetical protein